MAKEIVPRIDTSIQPTELDELVFAKYVEKRWHAQEVEPREARVKDSLREAKKSMGVDRMTASGFLGADAGMIYMAKKSGKPSEKGVRFTCYDVQAVTDWMDRERPDTDCFAQDNIEQFAEWYFRTTGEVPDGCQAIPYETEATPDTFTPTLKVNSDYLDAVVEQMGGNLFESAERLMLGEGDGGY